MARTAIVDYGVGNLKSIVNAMNYLGLQTEVTDDPARIALADSILLPGVGAFPDAADKLRRCGLEQSLLQAAGEKPILGICLGMQLLFDESEEVRPCRGLGLIPGRIRRIQTDQKLPHIGWNDLRFPNPSPLFRGLDEGSYVYFVHSFCGEAKDPAHVIASTEYGETVTAAVQKGTIFGCQFHPEKSGDAGLQILRNFGELNR